MAESTSTSEDDYSSGDDEDDEDILEVNKNNQDYFELPLRKGGKMGTEPATKDLVLLPREKLALFKQLYEKQPTKIKEMMRVPFYNGKPVINPSPLRQFVNQMRRLHLKKKLKKKRDLTKCRGVGRVKRAEGKINTADVYETDANLIHVDYPGRIVHLEKAIETMGGLGQITKVFNNVTKKLHVRFRPDDPNCNSTKGEAVPSIGILLKVQYRRQIPKLREDKESTKSTSTVFMADSIIINGEKMSKEKIMYEDGKLIREATKDSEVELQQHQIPGRLERSYLKLPKQYNPKVNNNIRVEVVGVVNKSYTFEGISDFQYLPLKSTKVGAVSTRDSLFPIVGAPSENTESLFVCDKLLEGEAKNDYADIIPPFMSRIDKPLDTVVEYLMDADNMKIPEELKEKSGVISTTRPRRNVYTVTYNFSGDNTNPTVPMEPLPKAVDDIKKRPIQEPLLQKIQQCFQEKPIWSKLAIEYETNQSSFSLKYILPCVAYFASNGPWRALWIRLGYDPRKHQTAFLYQTVDFRVPGILRCHMEDPDKPDDTLYIFRPNMMPCKGQMIYQLCHLKLVEVDRLISSATAMAEKGDLQYDHRNGWLKEETFEYIRHVLMSYIESYLEELGKVPEVRTKRTLLPEGEIQPAEKLAPRSQPTKRLRKVKSYNPKVPASEHNSESTNVSGKSKSRRKSKVKTKPPTQWAYQGILEDLLIKEIKNYGTKKDEPEILDDDDSLLLSDEDDDDEDYNESVSASESDDDNVDIDDITTLH